MFQHMFALGLPVAEKILRPILVYAFLVVLLRIFGKRELAQLNPFDLVVLLLLSNTVQNAIIGEDNSVSGGVIGAITLLLCNYVVVRFMFRHRRLDQLIEGKPTTLIREGKVLNEALAKELITHSELQVIARRQGYEGLQEIEECVLEPGGGFVMKRKVPPADEVRHGELSKRLDALSAQLARIEAKMKTT